MDIDPAALHRVPADGSFEIAKVSSRPPAGCDDESALKSGLKKQVRRLARLQRRFHADGRHALLLVFQGLDAAGKDSTIRKVFSGVNPAGFRYTAFGRPSERERSHDFLWRCQRALPARGAIGIFNRSHYEEVLVVRVHPEFLTAQKLDTGHLDELWATRFESIRNWERHLVANGTRVLKFWLNVSREEQRRRFLARIDQPEKNWKFSMGDLEVRARWADYMDAYQEALRHTSTDEAPWFAIPADSKPYMRWAVATIINRHIEGLKPRWPRLDPEQQAALGEARRRLLAEG